MIYVTSQRDTLYFIWQLLVQEKNFQEHGIDMSKVYHLIGYNDTINSNWSLYKNYFKGNLVFIKDDRVNKNYLLSLRFHILSEFYKNNPHFVKDYTFHLDADVIFREELLLETMMDGRIHLSDTDHYTGYTHFQQTKVPEILQDMAAIVGINVETVKSKKAGGAQWFYSGLDSDFFKRCEIQSEQMHTQYFNKLTYYKSKFYNCENNVDVVRIAEENSSNKFNFQNWTFEMWVWLWNMWKIGKTTYNNPELDFSWATDSLQRYNECSIFHNAGINNGDVRFNKQNYINSLPFNKNIPVMGNAQDEYIRLINSIDINAEYEVSKSSLVEDSIKFTSFLYITDNTKDVNISTYLNHAGHKELLIFNVGKTQLTLHPEHKNQGIRIINSEFNTNTWDYYKSLDEVRQVAYRFLFSKNITEKVECANLL